MGILGRGSLGIPVFSCGWSDCGSVALSGVPVVTDVPVSPSYAVAVMSEDFLSDSGWVWRNMS